MNCRRDGGHQFARLATKFHGDAFVTNPPRTTVVECDLNRSQRHLAIFLNLFIQSSTSSVDSTDQS